MGAIVAPMLVPPAVVQCPEVVTPADYEGPDQTVVVELLIDEAGSVERVVGAQGVEPMSGIAAEAAADCTFTPATEDGVPVAVQIPMSFHFPAHPIVVSGVLLAGGGGGPLPRIAIEVAGQRTRTGEDGSFAFTRIAPGEHEVTLVDALWRLPDQTTLTIEQGGRTEVELWARPERWSAEGLGLYEKEPRPGIHHTLTRDEIAAVPGSLGDPVRALQNLPGVVRTPFDAGWLLVRGGDADDTGVFLDGVRIPLLFHLGGHTSVLHPNLVEQVEFHPSTPPARLGHGTSGAANLEPRRLDGRTAAAAGLNTGYAHAFAEAPVLGGGVAIGARRSYLDGLLGVMFGPEGRDAAPRFSDAALRFDSQRVGVTVLGMTDAALVPTGDGNEVADLQQRAFQAQVRGTVPVGQDTEVQARAWYAVEQQRVRTDNRDQTLDQQAPGMRLEWTHDGTIQATAGFEAERREFGVDWNGLQRAEPATHLDPYGELTAGNDLRARLGIRIDTLFVGDHLPRVGWSPRGDVRWTLSKRLAFVGEAGRFNQAPPLALVVGMPDGRYLPLDRADVAGVGLRLTGDVVAFDADFWGRRSTFAAFELDRSLGAHQGRAGGVELTTRVLTGATRARFIAQLSRTERREAPGHDWVVGRFDQPVRLVALVMRDLPRAWMFSVRARYGTGFAYLGSEGQAYDVLTGEFVELTPSPNGRLPPTWSIDAKVSKRFTWRTTELDVYLDVLNATWNRVPEPVINGIDNDVAVYTIGLPTLPLFGVEGRWLPPRRVSPASTPD